MSKLERYADIRVIENENKSYTESEYTRDDIKTYTFNERTIFLGSEEEKNAIISKGMNPGLGVRKLHSRGINGSGVTAAIIDQNLLLNHPEFRGKIIEYYDTGCEVSKNEGSMHAPAVTSLFVGNNIGVAPETKLYFAAVPSWKGDSNYFADALLWIIKINRKLPKNDKIRVVSVSSSPSGYDFYINQEAWIEAVNLAQSEDLMIIDCRDREVTGFVAPAYYDIDDPDNIRKCKTGFASRQYVFPQTEIGVPSSCRTVAEEYEEGYPSYAYDGNGGLSWAIPYAAGILCLGWQINSSINQEIMKQMLFDSCYINSDNCKIINPVNFIDKIKEYTNFYY